MAGGKLSPRQKMVNLMYLVFIAMLALNIGKEVLAAFGVMNEKLEATNVQTDQNNASFLASLDTKKAENPEKFGKLYDDAVKINKLSADYNSYLENLKTEMLEGVKDKKDFQTMDKSDFLDTKFFGGDKVTEAGQEFLKNFEDYRNNVTKILGPKMAGVAAAVKARFTTGDEEGKVMQGKTKVDWLNYHYERVPLAATITKLTGIQADVKATQQDALKAMLEGQLSSEVSMTNYTTLLEQEKSAFYSGEKFSGAVVLGRKDATTRPNEVNLTLDGRKLAEGKDYQIKDGQVKLLVSAGAPGDHKIEGNLVFVQDGERTEVPVSSTFATISKPNAALIAADKMNVVYRGVANPMSISIPGIPNNKVSASATGLKKVSGSKYVMNPKSGRNVTITASGTLPDGQRVSSKSEFRIKDIPRPSGTLSKQAGSVKLPRKNVEIGTIGAMLEDFDFDLNLKVSGFKFKVPGQPTVSVSGSRLDSRAKSALKRAKRGGTIQIFDINAYISNNKGYKLKKVSPVVIELTN